MFELGEKSPNNYQDLVSLAQSVCSASANIHPLIQCIIVLNLFPFSLLMRLYVNRLGLRMNGENFFSLWVFQFSIHVVKQKHTRDTYISFNTNNWYCC